MTDDKAVHIEGYALTYDGDCGRTSRAVLERAVARRPTVPLRIGDRIICRANLSVDDIGLRVKADLEPLGVRMVGVDEGVPVFDRVHNTRAPETLRLGQADLSVSLQTPITIDDVAIHARPAEERDK